MGKRFIEIVNQCQKPNVELLREILSARREFSETESNFITYMAGFSHYEFSESLFQSFNLAFLEGTSILLDANNKKIHFKILLNDQAHILKKLHLGSVERDFNSPVYMTRMDFRDHNGTYIKRLGKQLRGCSGNEFSSYMARGISGVSENVVSYQRYLQDYCLVVHFAIATEPNVDINLKTVFSRTTATIFVHSVYDTYNLSLHRLQDREDLYSIFKDIHWYILDTPHAEKIVDFLQKIKANFKLVQFVNKEYDYLSEVLPEIEQAVLKQCDHFYKNL